MCTKLRTGRAALALSVAGGVLNCAPQARSEQGNSVPLARASEGQRARSEFGYGAESVAVVVPIRYLDSERSQLRQVALSPFFCPTDRAHGIEATGVDPDQRRDGFFRSEAFTAFLISPRHVMTARHAICCDASCNCNHTASVTIVFGYDKHNADVAAFRVKRVVDYGRAFAADWVILELDARVDPNIASPLAVTQHGPEELEEPLFAIAYPLGDTRKVLGPGRIVSRSDNSIATTIDCTSGCSGSPLLSSSGVVVGMNNRGKATDYDEDDQCHRVPSCPAEGCIGNDAWMNAEAVASSEFYHAVRALTESRASQ